MVWLPGQTGPLLARAPSGEVGGISSSARAVVHSSQCEVEKPRLATYLENDEDARRPDAYRLLLQARVRQAQSTYQKRSHRDEV